MGARTLAVDEREADIWAKLSQPDPVPPIDGLIAATALAHDLILVTRDTKTLHKTGVTLFNPFER